MRVIVQFPLKLHTLDVEILKKVALNEIFFINSCKPFYINHSITAVYNYFPNVKN